jgi:hypothetical protein
MSITSKHNCLWPNKLTIYYRCITSKGDTKDVYELEETARRSFIWLSEQNTEAMKARVKSLDLKRYTRDRVGPLCVLDENGFILCMNDDFSAIVHVPDAMRITYPFVGRLLDSPSTVLMRTSIECFPSSSDSIPIEPCTWMHRRAEKTCISRSTYDWYLIKQNDIFVLYGKRIHWYSLSSKTKVSPSA